MVPTVLAGIAYSSGTLGLSFSVVGWLVIIIIILIVLRRR